MTSDIIGAINTVYVVILIITIGLVARIYFMKKQMKELEKRVSKLENKEDN